MTAIAESVWESAPPSDVAAEAAVLGGVMISARALEDVAGVLAVEDFYRPGHQMIWAAAIRLYDQGSPVDPLTVRSELGRDLTPAGGAPYLHTLIRDLPGTAGSTGYYARIVLAAAVRRRLLQAGQRITQLAQAENIPDLIDRAETTLLEAVRAGQSDGGRKIGDLVDEVLDNITANARIAGLQTGYQDLDLLLKPMKPGQLIVIGARPSIGKSVMATDLCRYVSMHCSEPSVFASLEMSEVEVTTRIVAAASRTALDVIDADMLSEDDWVRVAKARDRLNASPLIVDETPRQTVASLRTLVRRHKPRLLVVDYLQLVIPPRDRESGKDRREAVDELTRGFKLLAKSEQITVVLLAQLNRSAEARHDKRPQLADLRESGSIEQDADVVILLHRPEFYDPADKPGEVELIVCKQRNGRTGVAHLAAQLSLARFCDLSRTLS